MVETLLTRFAQTRDEQAFAAIVEKYGPLVFAVCWRVLGQTQDAEDSAQAVFLTLAQKTSALTNVASLDAWLHHVAWQVALDARKLSIRRRMHEQEAAAMAQRNVTAGAAPDEKGELSEWLDQEIGGLPAKFRVPIVLHHLRGHTQEETARLLNENAGTIATRLNRGREMLKDRLAQHGVVMSVGSLSALAPETIQVPAAFVASTAKAASLLAAGQAASAGLLSTQTQLLIKGALKMLIWEKVKVAATIAVLVLIAGAGAAPFALRAWSAEAEPAPAPVVAPPAPKPASAPAALAFDNSRTLSGSVKQPGEAANVLGSKGVLVIRSAERLKRVLGQLARFGWDKPADDKNPLAKVDFSKETVFCAIDHSHGGQPIGELKCHAVKGDANAAEVQFVTSYFSDPSNSDAFAAPIFHFALVAVPNAKSAKVSVATYKTVRAPAVSETPDMAKVEWSDTFDAQRGDWVDGLSATIAPEKAAISAGDDIRLKFTLTFNSANAVKTGDFGEKLKSAFVWDGKYSNGYSNHSFLVERPDGNTIVLTVPPIGGWDKNAPHPEEVTAAQPYVLPGWVAADSLKSLLSMTVWSLAEGGQKSAMRFKTDMPGVYKITGIYREDATAFSDGARKIQPTMWGGDIASNTVEIEVKAK